MSTESEQPQRSLTVAVRDPGPGPKPPAATPGQTIYGCLPNLRRRRRITPKEHCFIGQRSACESLPSITGQPARSAGGRGRASQSSPFSPRFCLGAGSIPGRWRVPWSWRLPPQAWEGATGAAASPIDNGAAAWIGVRPRTGVAVRKTKGYPPLCLGARWLLDREEPSSTGGRQGSVRSRRRARTVGQNWGRKRRSFLWKKFIAREAASLSRQG